MYMFVYSESLGLLTDQCGNDNGVPELNLVEVNIIALLLVDTRKTPSTNNVFVC